MEYDIWYRIAVVGATIILAFGRIFRSIRPKYYFFHCPMCIGFHVGWIFALMYLFYYGKEINALFLFREACVGSILSYVIGMVFNDDGINFIERHKHDHE